MKPEITIKTIVDAIANLLDSTFGYPVRSSPAQQKQNPPFFSIIPRPSNITKRLYRYEYEPKFDIVYYENYNLPDAFDRCAAIACQLDKIMELIPAVDEYGSAFFIRTYNRNWSVDIAELHYMIDFKLFVSTIPTEPVNMMEVLDEFQFSAVSEGESCASFIKEQQEQ